MVRCVCEWMMRSWGGEGCSEESGWWLVSHSARKLRFWSVQSAVSFVTVGASSKKKLIFESFVETAVVSML